MLRNLKISLKKAFHEFMFLIITFHLNKLHFTLSIFNVRIEFFYFFDREK